MTELIEGSSPGVALAVGDHVCALYFGEAERDAVMLPFLRAGLAAGDKCLCIIEMTPPSDVVGAVGADAERYVASRQLEVQTTAATYHAGIGTFTSAGMLDFMESSIATAIDTDGYPLIRIAGEGGWALSGPTVLDDLLRYESELNRRLAPHPQITLCLYDLSRFGGAIVVEMMKTHPKLVLGGLVLDNPHYLSPDEMLAWRP